MSYDGILRYDMVQGSESSTLRQTLEQKQTESINSLSLDLELTHEGVLLSLGLVSTVT